MATLQGLRQKLMRESRGELADQHVLWLSQTDSSITGKIQWRTLAQTRAQAANSVAIPTFWHADGSFAELLTERASFVAHRQPLFAHGSITGFDSAALVSARCQVSFFFVAPLLGPGPLGRSVRNRLRARPH